MHFDESCDLCVSKDHLPKSGDIMHEISSLLSVFDNCAEIEYLFDSNRACYLDHASYILHASLM